ncbi:3',5'-cyclic adenosine monophosphate phosphodiesterase [Candidatus Photodesmus blepharus]|uniref:3',5'-cyclic adenosine monophosphate phosphodiesterase CpdA n=1 Tax=Candidatus Photodesmus blepharonis TaxID=1179155 RepID=A0A084CMM5_9GAMM|nr:3',5'-cyclic-AMP phosphodiesterase [Candidatus Photodesmus blepharus]KEY91054.1 3',5'-cyclic adenosine monophosphate phosphodiesterase [Candidatus Photodesmus blepharus]
MFNLLGSSIKLLQITDTHLFARANGNLLSIKTLDSFRAVLDAIVENDIQFDIILATGDISQDHSAKSYQRFVDGVSVLKQPCLWLPGNHDDKLSMWSGVPSKRIFNLEHVLLSEHWQIIMLDSQVIGVPYGYLRRRQIELLDRKLSQYHNYHTLVLLHHHPLLVGSIWLDRHSLKDSKKFWKVIDKYDTVRVVLCGHVHQNMDQYFNNVRVLSTPSTCVQFKPNSNNFALDKLSPGWRELELHTDGSISTKVQRLGNGCFLPSFDEHGY